MAIQINGAGTIDGIAVGGLNDGIITDAELNLSANASNIKTALNAGGDAPVYACRAWVNFNGTGTVAIRASGNVTGITDNGTGDYTVNFTTAMVDADYAVSAFGPNRIDSTNTTSIGYLVTGSHTASPITYTSSSLRIAVGTSAGSGVDGAVVSLAIFR